MCPLSNIYMNLAIINEHNEIWFYTAFGIIIALFLIIDLGFMHKQASRITFKEALYQSIFWVLISVAFGLAILFLGGGSEQTFEYFSAYITEKALSLDNIFVIILILKYFKIDEIYYHKILFWGILGAIVFRAIFIFIGAILISKFTWILYIFGVFLVYQGFRIMFENSEDNIDPGKSPVLRFARRYLRLTKTDAGGKFIVRIGGKLFFTPLFLVLILIETTDLIFAVDSIPAAFAITTDEFVIYTSNIFAVLGLRALFFLLADIINKFHLLQKGLSFILIFIGIKMLLEIFHIHIPTYVSFAFILLSIVLSMILSVIIPNKEEIVLDNEDTKKKSA